jgi:predicted dehydrogenase
MTSFGIVGSGWRTEFFCRVAEALPEKFKVSGIVARRQERGEELEARFGISTYRDLESMLGKISADFVITSVPWAENPLVLSELAAAGVPALSETPPAPDLEGLRRVFQLVEDGARIQVAEQYNRQPHHAARLGFVRGGLLVMCHMFRSRRATVITVSA